MDTLSSQSFPTHVPFQDPIVITHFTCMVFAFLICYPLLQVRRQQQKLYICSVFALIGFISGCFIQLTQQTTTINILFQLSALILLCLLYLQMTLVAYRHNDFIHSMLDPLLHSIPDWIDHLLGWITFIVALGYMAISILVFTDSCTEEILQSQCLAPLAMGSGFLLYGTCILLHLLAIIKLPRLSTPEYYEGVIITFWGIINLLFSGTPILGSAWRAINLGLLWFSGGLFSIISSVQTWLPALREKNIINSIIIFLTGRAIVRGITHTDDAYTSEVHTTLGYILIIGSIARITQTIFRKSPVNNLPYRMFHQHTTDAMIDEEDEDEPDVLVKDPVKCKHHFIFASITLISGILASFLAIGGGILFMGANIGWIRYMRYYIQDPATYVNVILACAFLWCAYVFGLCTLYKTQNATHPYDYLELAPVEQEDEERRDWIYSEEPTDVTLQAVTSPIFPSPIDPDPFRPSSYTETTTTTIRPSEYRAKRRSLLLNNNTTMTINTKKRSSSGVGGILPDEPDSSPFRKSWLSSGSSIGYYSGGSAPNSPPLLDKPPYASISSTLPHSQVNNSQRGRSNSETSSNYYEESVHKTKSGRRKERLQKMNNDRSM